MIAPTARIVAALKARHPDVPVIGFPKGAGGKLPPMRARPASMRSGSTRRSIRSGRTPNLPADMPVQGNLDPLALIAGGAALENAVRAHPIGASRSGRTSSTLATASCQDTPIAHVEQLLETGAPVTAMIWGMSADLDLRLAQGRAFIFVIFWMAGLFMLPRFYVYHQESAARLGRGSSVDRARAQAAQDHPHARDDPGLDPRPEPRLHRPMLWDQAWFHAKFALVFALSGYHGWMVGYGKKLAKGERAGRAARRCG